jgi:hypothetical protein
VSFGLTACTPDQLRLPEGKFVAGYGMLIVADYDSAHIYDAIKRRVERTWGDSSAELIKDLAHYAWPLPS